MGCWLCKQRAEWRREKKNEARVKAQMMANVTRGTIVIIKEGPLYKVMKLADASGKKVLELIIGNA